MGGGGGLGWGEGFFRGNLVLVGKFPGIFFLGEGFLRTLTNNPLLMKSSKLKQSFNNLIMNSSSYKFCFEVRLYFYKVII